MAHNEYYTFNQGRVNGKILMSASVFDVIVKNSVKEIDNVYLDTSKARPVSGAKSGGYCSIKNNEVFIKINVDLKYGVNVSKITKEIQTKVATSIRYMTGVKVKKISIDVDNIIF